MNSAACSGETPIIVRTSSSSTILSKAIEPITARGARLLRGRDRELQLLEGRLGLDDDAVGAASTSACACSRNARSTSRRRDLAVGLHQPAERTDVAEHVAASAERLARDAGRRRG